MVNQLESARRAPSHRPPPDRRIHSTERAATIPANQRTNEPTRSQYLLAELMSVTDETISWYCWLLLILVKHRRPVVGPGTAAALQWHRYTDSACLRPSLLLVSLTGCQCRVLEISSEKDEPTAAAAADGCVWKTSFNDHTLIALGTQDCCRPKTGCSCNARSKKWKLR